MTIGNPALCLFLYLTGVHFRGELKQGGDVSQQETNCRPIRTREIDGVSLSEVLYAKYEHEKKMFFALSKVFQKLLNSFRRISSTAIN